MWKNFVEFVLRPKWVVYTTCPEDTTLELGLQIWGVIFSMYKGSVYTLTKKTIFTTRPPYKREFGESLHPTPSNL